ncbi:MAG: RNA polymerase sigma factor [Planctomycetota bacterium]
MQNDDRRLLEQAVTGDRAAFDALVDRYCSQFLRLAYGLVGERAAAEDVVQETFAAAFSGMRGYRGEATVRTWLIAILARQAGRHRRRERLRRHRPIDRELTHAGIDPEKSTELRLDLATVLEGLDERYRRVIVLREVEGLSYEEIANALGLPRGTVESRLHRARAALREALKDYIE